MRRHALLLPLLAPAFACGPGVPASPPPAPVLLDIAPGAPAPSSPVAEAPEQADDEPAVEGMAWIRGGRFMMGYLGCDHDERPEHEVAVRGFYLDLTEVTAAAYQRCVDARRCEPAGAWRPGVIDDDDQLGHCNAGRRDRMDHPINCVTWIQADAYCRAQGKRLPTEEEWEFAARGPKGRTFPWGDSFDPDRLCWGRSDGTCAVGSFPTGNTPEGLGDMAGNVWEWTATHYCDYEQPGCGDETWVDRGGAWVSDEERLVHGAHRGRGSQDVARSYIGLRCAKDANGS